MHQINTDAQAYEQRKQAQLQAEAALAQNADEMARANDSNWAAALAGLNERRARLYGGGR